MTYRPKITIAMPVYNGGEYFEQALDSALSQSYDDVEIIVVNDGSTDGGHTDRVAQRYAKHIRYIHKENGGVASALNAVISNMAGDAFTWLSHDDLFEPHKTEIQVDFWLQINKPTACLISDFYLIDANGVIINEIKLDREPLLDHPMLPLYRGMISGCTVFIPRAVLNDVGNFDLRLRHTQDYDLWRRIVAKHEFFLVPQTLVRSRQHPNQDSRKSDAVLETEALWRNMVLGLTELQRAGMYGSSYRFWKETSQQLYYSPNKQASALCAKKAEAALSETPVSVVIRTREDSPPQALRQSLESVRAQSYTPAEILLVAADTSALPETARDTRQVITGDIPVRAQWNSALATTAGTYVALLEAGDVFAPNKIEIQVTDLMTTGARASTTAAHTGAGMQTNISSLLWSQGSPPLRDSVPISTVMVHRSLIASGLLFGDGGRDWDTATWARLVARGDLRQLPQALSTLIRAESSSADIGSHSTNENASRVA
jgi:glycosyltransferase involved in cell wall biosynthesis